MALRVYLKRKVLYIMYTPKNVSGDTHHAMHHCTHVLPETPKYPVTKIIGDTNNQGDSSADEI